MTKVRTVIPPNAKPGQSVIQVKHPKTGKPTRVQVPKNAVPGQMIELELPDSSGAQWSDITSSGSLKKETVESGHPSDTASTGSGSISNVSYGSFGPVVVIPPPTQNPPPLPFGARESHGSEAAKGPVESEPLLSKPEKENRGWWSRLSNPCGLCGCLFD
jgi:hypothetical protein